MKKLCIKLIEFYQKFSKLKPSKCRLFPTCSEYAKISIERFGAWVGVWLSVKRLFRCSGSSKILVDKPPQNIKGDFKWLI